MALRPPVFQRALTRGTIAPRLMAPALTRTNTNSSTPPTSPFVPRPASTQSTPLGLGALLGDYDLLSRSRPAPTSSSAVDDALSMEFPAYSGASTMLGAPQGGMEDNMHRLCVYATKHNTHITLTRPNKDVLLTLSCGNVGFKKANRGTFEAAYQLASVMFQRMDEKGLRPRNLEIEFRDFGPGRDAFTKVLLGKEGKGIRSSVRRVTDVSRLKFGGTRSRAIRRL